MTTAMRELAVYLNPFSMATQQPRIPDGARNFSLGLSHRGQTTSVGRAHRHILLIPGLVGHMFVRDSDSPLFPPIDSATEWLNMGLTDFYGATEDDDNNTALLTGPLGIVIPAGPPPMDTDGGGGAAGPRLTASSPETRYAALGASEGKDIESWRVVSQGLKIKPLNNMLNNDGHYRAIRIRNCPETVFINQTLRLMPVVNVPRQSDWANDPSFVSGRLHDLSNKSFMLATEDNTHEFKNISYENIQRYDNLIDSSFDMIAITITGSANTQLLLDVYQNVETVYRAGSVLTKFQTQTNQINPLLMASTNAKKRMRTLKAC